MGVRDRIITTKTKAYDFPSRELWLVLEVDGLDHLSHLKRLEPHSPINLESTLHQAPKYLDLGK